MTSILSLSIIQMVRYSSDPSEETKKLTSQVSFTPKPQTVSGVRIANPDQQSTQHALGRMATVTGNSNGMPNLQKVDHLPTHVVKPTAVLLQATRLKTRL